MVSPQQLREAVESALLGPSPPTPSQRIELMHALRSSIPALKSFLFYPAPSASDRAQVQLKEVRLPNSPPISLDDTDVAVALKLSDDLNLNEIDCVRLLVSANKEWGLSGREPMEIFRLAAGLWYMERRDLITSLYTLLRSVVLDHGLETDLALDIQMHLEDLMSSGLRQRLITLIKELNREESAGFGGPSAERYVLDSRGACIQRRDVVSRERLSLGHCLVFSAHILRLKISLVRDGGRVFPSSEINKRECSRFAGCKRVWFAGSKCQKQHESSGGAKLQDLWPSFPPFTISLKIHCYCFRLIYQVVCALKFSVLLPKTLAESILHMTFKHWEMMREVKHRRDAKSKSASHWEVKFLGGAKEVKNVFSTLKDSSTEATDTDATVQLQITFSLLFSLVVAFMSDALSTTPDKASVLSNDTTFRPEFHDLVMASNNLNVEGFVNAIRLAWAMHLVLTQDQIIARRTVSSTSKDLEITYSCLDIICSSNVFQFLLSRVLQTAAYQNDDEDMVCIYNGYMHKLIMCFVSHPLTRDKVKEMKERAMSALSPYVLAGSADFRDDTLINTQQVSRINCQPFVSLMELISEIYEACTEEGAVKVFELLQGKAFRSIGWSTLFDCLSIYDEKFKQSFHTSGSMLPDFQEGDAEALVAYLNVLQKVVQNGDPIERRKWFPDIEPLFKLLSYENVPPYLKGALRDAIASFVGVSQVMKDTIWSYLEQYDLPVVVGPVVGSGGQNISHQVYDMRFELNEVEARREKYPSTISFLNLLNTLIAEERDVSDKGRRLAGIFRFVYDHVFRSFPQRAYADPSEKWKLVVACLHHFKMILSMYEIKDEDMNSAVDPMQPAVVSHGSPIEMQLPILELLKDFMSGKTVLRNIMNIISLGVTTIINDRVSQIYGPLMEKAVHLSLEIIILVLERDFILADFWRPLYQPLDVILAQDHNQIVALLEYVRYDILPQIQQCSIKILSVLSSRMVGLVQLLLKSNAAKSLIEDLATCLESRFDECQVIENTKDDAGVLILQLIIDNISRPVPNLTHLLLKFDLDGPVERTVLQPKFHYSCLKVILDNLEKLSKPDINALLHEFGFQLIYELYLDPMTSGPIMDLLGTKKYQFFSQHLETVCVAPLPKRNSSQTVRISSLHQRAWLLKILALEIHLADVSSSTHRETIQAILCQLFPQCFSESSRKIVSPSFDSDATHGIDQTMKKNKVLELLEVVQFRCPEIAISYPRYISNLKYEKQVEDILKNPSSSEAGGVYYYSERGDRLIDLDAFHDKLWQIFKTFSPQVTAHLSEVEKGEVKESIQQLLRWGWRCNKNLEEQAAQLHMLTGWSHIVEVSISRRFPFLEDGSQLLLELLAASLSASASPDCSLKMAIILSHVALTCMAKLRDERFLFPGGMDSDNVTCLDIISGKQLPNGACQSILFKLMMSILRSESSDALRRRQYALLLSYFQYCRSILDPDVPSSVLKYLLHEEHNADDELSLHMIVWDQSELTRANFAIIRKEAQAIIDVDCYYSLESLQRLYTLEAQLSLLLRISHHYGKHGAQILLSMGALEHLASCKGLSLQIKGSLRHANMNREQSGDVDMQRLLVTPILRLVYSLTSMVDSSDFLEVKNKIVRETIDFTKAHESTFDHIMREDLAGADEPTLERVNLVVSILSKVWSYEENDEYGFVQELFGLMRLLFHHDIASFKFIQSSDSVEDQRKSELIIYRLCFSLTSYLYFLITRKHLRLQVLDVPGDLGELHGQQQPTLLLLVKLLTSVADALEKTGEEKYLLLSKIQDINELSGQEVDEIINVCMRSCLSIYDNIQKRRYFAMVEMCRMAGNRDQLIALLLKLADHIFNILLIHFQDHKTEPRDISLLCEKFHPTLERLEQLREDKVGDGLKLFRRSVSALKEMSVSPSYGLKLMDNKSCIVTRIYTTFKRTHPSSTVTTVVGST